MVFSFFFYAWGEPFWILLLFATACADWVFSRLIEAHRGRASARTLLIASLTLNLSLLGVFKYTGFFVENFNALFSLSLPVPHLALPLGISFYTFQSISYVVDVYRGRVPASRRYTDYLTYLSMYPQLVAGPIVRYSAVEGELRKRRVSLEEGAYGCLRFCVGLAKKVVLANTAGALCAQYLNGDLTQLSVAGAWYGIVLYGLQIYFDFSGYSDMAIGLGRIFGFHYFENFNYPYIARSVTEFWRRWHISLGSFFRDYVYIPLGGNRRRQYFNLAVVWFLTGLWHGPSWNFILWGLLYGVFIALERLFLHRFFARLPRIFSHLYLLLLVLIGWVFFYFAELSRALQFLKVMFFAAGAPLSDPLFVAHFMNNLFFFLLALLCCLPFAPKIREIFASRGRFYAPGALAAGQIALCLLFLALSTAMLVGESYNPFLYFRF